MKSASIRSDPHTEGVPAAGRAVQQQLPLGEGLAVPRAARSRRPAAGVVGRTDAAAAGAGATGADARGDATGATDGSGNDWHLDERTRALGRAGVAAARAHLARPSAA